MSRLCGHDAIDRPVVLIGLYVFVLVAVIIEDLNLHADISCVAGQRRTNAKSVISSRLHFDFEADAEVAEFLIGVKVPPTILAAHEQTVLRTVTSQRALPST